MAAAIQRLESALARRRGGEAERLRGRTGGPDPIRVKAAAARLDHAIDAIKNLLGR